MENTIRGVFYNQPTWIEPYASHIDVEADSPEQALSIVEDAAPYLEPSYGIKINMDEAMVKLSPFY